MNYKEIISSINKKDLSPVYFLMGNEPYYIDILIDMFLNNILTEEEKMFNQKILYGKDTEINHIISEAKQFPINSKKRIVIVKEAQDLKNIEKIDGYLESPQKSTILILAYKNKSLDKRKTFSKNLHKKCIVFESKKLYESEIPSWIKSYINERGYQTNDKTTILLSEYLGANLSKIKNELEKIIISIQKDQVIDTSLIQKYIGISKDYNVFELQDALGNRDLKKISAIINYFRSNPKNHNIIMIISSLFSFFQKIIIYKSINNININMTAKILKVNPFFIKQYQNAAKNYSKKQLFYIFEHLKRYDLKSKGVNNKNTKDKDLLKELMLKILHT